MENTAMNNNVVDVTSPICREEMIAYINYSMGITNTIVESLKKFIEEQNGTLIKSLDDFTKKIEGLNLKFDEHNTLLSAVKLGINDIYTSQSEIKSSIDTAADTYRTVSFTIDKRRREAMKPPINPLFYTIKDAKFRNLWIKDAQGEIARICIDQKKEEPLMYKTLYQDMADEGYDVNALLNEYRKNNSRATMLDMISSSDALRNLFTKKIYRYSHQRIVNNIKTLYENNLTSECMANIVNKYFGTKRIPGTRYTKIYKLMGIDNSKEYLAEGIKKYGLCKSARMPEVFAREPEMLKKFEEAIIRIKAEEDFN